MYERWTRGVRAVDGRCTSGGRPVYERSIVDGKCQVEEEEMSLREVVRRSRQTLTHGKDQATARYINQSIIHHPDRKKYRCEEPAGFYPPEHYITSAVLFLD